jgi:hypothetical protein
VTHLSSDLTTQHSQPQPQVHNVAALGQSCVPSATVFGCTAGLSSKRDIPDLFGKFTTSQRVIVGFAELSLSVAALDWLALSLERSFNDGMVVAQ